MHRKGIIMALLRSSEHAWYCYRMHRVCAGRRKERRSAAAVLGQTFVYRWLEIWSLVWFGFVERLG